MRSVTVAITRLPMVVALAPVVVGASAGNEKNGRRPHMGARRADDNRGLGRNNDASGEHEYGGKQRNNKRFHRSSPSRGLPE